MKADNKHNILFINMAKGFGGGEVQTEQLMLNLDGYTLYFLGKKHSKLAEKLAQAGKNIRIITFMQALKLALCTKQLIIHAQDGRGAHIAGLLKLISRKPIVITRHVSFPLKRKISSFAYKIADQLVGVSSQVSEVLAKINPNTQTIHGCLKPLQEDLAFEEHYFKPKKGLLRIGHIGNLQEVKNFPLTIKLAKIFPQLEFYIVGSGPLEQVLKEEAKGLSNLTFIPFTPYIGSVLKHLDLQIIPSHLEGLSMVILEGYQYQVPVIAHATGGIPDIVEQGKTGFLIKKNDASAYQEIIEDLLQNPEQLHKLKAHIHHYQSIKDFSAQRMAKEYKEIYLSIVK
ncbi:glycosyl transferase [Pasteurellaceae bacterium RH1A]|nr:glycosyl transferase [Pasteurellaceae bacterium RH1A]